MCLVPHRSVDTHLILVLTYVFTVFNLVVCEALFSDHMPVLFDLPLACQMEKPCVPERRCRVFKSCTAAQFFAAFNQYLVISPNELFCVETDLEEFSSRFDSTCLSILDSVALLKNRLSRSRPEPWLNNATRAARCECRRAERKWKKDKL